jgi:hypothetical protein
VHLDVARSSNRRFATFGLARGGAPAVLAIAVAAEQVENSGIRRSAQPDQGDHCATESDPFHQTASPSLGIHVEGRPGHVVCRRVFRPRAVPRKDRNFRHRPRRASHVSESTDNQQRLLTAKPFSLRFS